MKVGIAIGVGLGLVALAIQAGCDDDCFETHSWHGTIDLPAEPRLQFAIDRCQRDATLCLDVCRTAMANVSYDRLDNCEVTVDATRASLEARYSNYRGGEGCTFALPDAAIVAVDASPVQDAPIVVPPDASP